MAHTALRLALSVALPLGFAIGCKPPPDAPAQLEELTSWLYGKVEVGTDEELEVGVNNLATWLDGRMDEATQGYTVDNLPRATANEADGRNGDLDGLVGASVATTIEAKLDDVEVAMMIDDQMDVFEGEYLRFDRDFDGNPRCFVRRDCDTEGARTESVNNYPLGLELTVNFRSQWRWVETEDGPAVIYRTWLRKEADVNKDWLSVHYQYFLGVNMPNKGKTRRLQTTWIAASLGDTPVPEDMALNMVIDGMIATDDTLTGYLNGL